MKRNKYSENALFGPDCWCYTAVQNTICLLFPNMLHTPYVGITMTKACFAFTQSLPPLTVQHIWKQRLRSRMDFESVVVALSVAW